MKNGILAGSTKVSSRVRMRRISRFPRHRRGAWKVARGPLKSGSPESDRHAEKAAGREAGASLESPRA